MRIVNVPDKSNPRDKREEDMTEIESLENDIGYLEEKLAGLYDEVNETEIKLEEKRRELARLIGG